MVKGHNCGLIPMAGKRKQMDKISAGGHEDKYRINLMVYFFPAINLIS